MMVDFLIFSVDVLLEVLLEFVGSGQVFLKQIMFLFQVNELLFHQFQLIYVFILLLNMLSVF